MIRIRLTLITVASSLSALLGAAPAPADPASLTWTQLSPTVSPSPRSYLAMTSDASFRKVVLSGGLSTSGYLNDTWTFDGITWTQVDTPVAPSPRTNAQMAYDRHTHQVILFGGYDGHRDLGDTWLWDGLTSTWTQAFPAHSPKAVTGPMVFTDMNGRVDEFGGFDGQFYQSTMWRWNDSDWRQLRPDSVPSARSSAGVGVNYVTKQVVLYGGLADVNPLNTWT